MRVFFWIGVLLFLCASEPMPSRAIPELTPEDSEGAAAAAAPGEAESGEAEPGTSEFSEAITVVSASRQRERWVEAPAAVTVVSGPEIARRASHGQVPKLLDFTPGIEVTQNGLYNFNLNVRGLNNGNTRRVVVLIDGRDPSLPILDAQEWANFSFSLSNLESLELLRGPASALYGSNSVNGVLNIVTKSPRETQGGRLRLAGGELETRRIEADFAGAAGEDLYYRLGAGHQRSKDFTRSRDQEVEYEGLPTEVIPLAQDRVEANFFNLRLDKWFTGPGISWVMEGGASESKGVTFATGAGRFQRLDSDYLWARTKLSGDHWDFLASHGTREGDQLQLNTGEIQIVDSDRTQVEIRGDWELKPSRIRLVAGAAYSRSRVEAPSLFFRGTEIEERNGVYAQLEFRPFDRLKAVVALRRDDNNRHDAEISPKFALVFSPVPEHVLRLTYNEAFQTPTTAEFFVQVPLGAPLDLSAVEASLAGILGDSRLGLERIPLLAVGNPSLEVERARSLELGYSAELGRRTSLAIDLHQSTFQDFVSSPLPQVGTDLGRLSPDFGPYRPRPELSGDAEQTVLATLEAVLGPQLFPALSNNIDGSPILALASLTNVGEVETTGLTVALRSSLSRRLQLQASYSYLDFEVKDVTSDSPLRLNAPENQAAMSLAYTAPRFDCSAHLKWVEGFDWLAGILDGPVPSYTVVDLASSVRLDDRWTLGINVSNLLDNSHYQLFGGDLLRRRALVSATLSW